MIKQKFLYDLEIVAIIVCMFLLHITISPTDQDLEDGGGGVDNLNLPLLHVSSR